MRHAGLVKPKDDQSKEKKYSLMLSKKLNKIRSDAVFADKFIRDRLTDELLDEIDAWRNERNVIVHAMMKKPYDEELMEEFAKRGDELQRIFDNKVRSVNSYLDKKDLKK